MALPALCCQASPSPTCSQLGPQCPNLWVLLCCTGGLAKAQGPVSLSCSPLRRAPCSRLPRGSNRFMFAKFCLVKP